jgi:hypothetical protein
MRVSWPLIRSGVFGARSNCRETKKPWKPGLSSVQEATSGFEPPNEGFADCCPRASRKCQIPRKGFPKPNEGLQGQIAGPLFGLLNRYRIIINNARELSTNSTKSLVSGARERFEKLNPRLKQPPSFGHSRPALALRRRASGSAGSSSRSVVGSAPRSSSSTGGLVWESSPRPSGALLAACTPAYLPVVSIAKGVVS